MNTTEGIDLIALADTIRTGAKRLEWVQKMATALEQIGSVDQARQESERRLAQARQDESLAVAQAEAAKARAEEMRVQGDDFLAKTRKEAEEITRGAREVMARAREEADIEAANIRSKARKEADTMTANAIADRERASAVVREKREELGRLTADAARVAQDVADGQKKLDEIRATINRLAKG